MSIVNVVCPWCVQPVELELPVELDELYAEAWAKHDPQTCFLAWITRAVEQGPDAVRWPDKPGPNDTTEEVPDTQGSGA